MLTTQELLYALVVPVVVAGVIASLGRWRRWVWAMPLAAGAAFLTGYALIRMPALPPRDGVDWLFWLTAPLTALGVAASSIARTDAIDSRRTPLAYALGLAAGLVALVIMLPLTRVGALSLATTVWTPVFVGVAGAGLVLALHFAIDRVGPAAVVLGLSMIAGGAGVIVMSSNLRTVGIYGLSAAAAIAAAGALYWDARGALGVAVMAVAIVAGLLTAGKYYPEPGVTRWEFALIFGAPLLLAGAGMVPLRSKRARAVVAVLAVAVFIGVLAIPKALAAKKAAEEDPYGAMYP